MEKIGVEQVLVVAVHMAVWLWYLPKLWNTSGLSARDFRILRQRHWNTPSFSRPMVLSDNTIVWSIFRTFLWSLAVGLLTKNYLVSHGEWSVAVFFFLIPTSLGIESGLWWRQRRYKEVKKGVQGKRHLDASAI